MVKICQTGLLKSNFETRPKKRIFRFLPKIFAGHGWSWKFFFANFQILVPLGCQRWVVILYLKMWKKSKSLHHNVHVRHKSISTGTTQALLDRHVQVQHKSIRIQTRKVPAHALVDQNVHHWFLVPQKLQSSPETINFKIQTNTNVSGTQKDMSHVSIWGTHIQTLSRN